MAKKVKPVPDGYHRVTPYLMVKGATKAIEFYKKAFSAEVKGRMDTPDGKVMHAELKVGDSIIMMAEEMPQMSGACLAPTTLKGTTVGLFLYVKNTDAAFKKAVDAGCTKLMAPADMFWGDRFGKVQDPFGHQWLFATHIKDLTPEEIKKGAESMFKQPSKV